MSRIRTGIYRNLIERGSQSEGKISPFAALQSHWRELVQSIGIVTGANVVLYLIFVFVLGVTMEAGASHIEEINTIGLAVTIRVKCWEAGFQTVLDGNGFPL